MTTEAEGYFNAARDYCAKRGTEEGKNAASWVFDGNTTRDTYIHVLKGLDDGDPAVLDMLPHADLSGEMADTTTGPSLVKDALTEVGIDPDSDEAQDWFTELCDAYEDAFAQAVNDEVERVARYQLDDDEVQVAVTYKFVVSVPREHTIAGDVAQAVMAYINSAGYALDEPDEVIVLDDES